MQTYKKRSDGRYQANIEVGRKPSGKPIRKCIYAKSLKELNEKRRKLLNEVDICGGITGSISLFDWSEKWLLVYKKDCVSYSTYCMYENMVHSKIQKSRISNKLISDVNEIDILNEVKKISIVEGLKRSAEIYLLTIKQIFNKAVDNGLLIRNVAKNISIPKSKPEEKRALTKEEQQLLLDCDFTDDKRCFLLLGLYAGLRMGEILALKKSDFDFDNMCVSVKKTIIFKKNIGEIQNFTKTAAGVRNIPIPKKVFNTLSKYIEPLSEDELLFKTKEGTAATKSYFRRFWDSILKQASEKFDCTDFTSHILRHTYATSLYLNDIDIKTSQYLLGHANFSITMNIYTHIEKNNPKVIRNNLSAFLEAN